MPFIFKRLALFMSIAAAFAADKEPASFRAAPAASFAQKQTNDRLTVGAELYMSGEKLKAAFGKLVPYQYGVLPVLVAMQNDSDSTIRLDELRVEYVGPRGDRVEATPAKDVRYAIGPRRPTVSPRPIPLPSKKKNPLNVWEIEGRAFAAQMLPAGNAAYGFFYFETDWQPGSTIYLTGFKQARSGNAIAFFELPLTQ
jgi:hypothetical protein